MRVGSKLLRGLALAGLALVLVGCSSNRERKYVARDVGALYNLGKDRLADRNFTESAAFFDEVERQHPFSVWARRAQLMSAYAYYQANKYDEAVLSAERFLSLHPGNRDAPYAHYLIAMCHYERIIDVGRDQKLTEKALAALEEVVRRYPSSIYAEDARLKLDLARDHLAGKEMEIGRFYQKQGMQLAAIIRFRAVVEQYDATNHVPEALERLVESYLSLGIKDEARRIAAVLGYNFPDSKWYRYAYELVDRYEG